MARRSRSLDPDTALEIRLSGMAVRLSRDLAPTQQAVDDLRQIAAGRSDLLSIAAGRILGGYLTNPTDHPASVIAAGYLTLAGADHDALVRQVDETRALGL